MRSGGLIDPDKAAELLETRDPALFSERLLEAAHSSVGVEELFAFRVDDGRPPTALASSSGLGDADERTRAYARRFHRSDPAVAARLATAPGSGFHLRVPAAAIELGAYRKLCFDRHASSRRSPSAGARLTTLSSFPSTSATTASNRTSPSSGRWRSSRSPA